jgi:hypothetical protein
LRALEAHDMKAWSIHRFGSFTLGSFSRHT